jgi:hypothetical protein
MADKSVHDAIKIRKNQFEKWLSSILPSDKKFYLMELENKSVDEFIVFIRGVVTPWETNLDFILKYTLEQCKMSITEIKSEDQIIFKKYMELFIKFVKLISVV